MVKQPITVTIADCNRARRVACERLLRDQQDISVVAQAATSEDVVATVLDLKPRVVVSDVALAADCDHSLLLTLRRECPATRVILLLGSTIKEERLMLALASGSVGFLTREAIRYQLPQAVRRIDRGEAWVPRKMLGRILDRLVK